VRVVVYNVRGFRSGTDQVADAVRRFEPELMLLQESGGRPSLRRFGHSMGMDVAGDPWSPFARRMKDAVLVRRPLRIVDHYQHRFPTEDRLYPRGAMLAHLEAEDRRLWAVSIHLGLRPAERLRHAEELAGLIEGLEGPILVGGDLNDRPDGTAARFLGERLWDAWLLGGDVAGETFPAEEPTARIDYLFVSQGVRVDRAIVPPTPEARTASDHRPLVVELAL
jgi:endonuclease/exonuclease/phosphatase family metal-dependent hydrolase